MTQLCDFRQDCVLMGTFAPEGLATLTATPAKLVNIGTIHLVTVQGHVFYVHPDITATHWELTSLQSAHR